MYHRQNDSDNRFAVLNSPRRIWAVAAIHGETERLSKLHDEIYRYIMPGDRLVYLGNYTGYGLHSAAAVTEILTFRRMVLALPGMIADDIVYLRGQQEEMWHKLLQLQFAPQPVAVLDWLLAHGMEATLRSYGLNPAEGRIAAQEGVMSLIRWAVKVRTALRRQPGHEIFTAQWRRAAYSRTDDDSADLLFVHAGINPALPLSDQGDSFWWADKSFNRITAPYNPFKKIIRGFDPDHNGLHINCVTATIDGGCGFGGSLVCAGIGQDSEIFDIIES